MIYTAFIIPVKNSTPTYLVSYAASPPDSETLPLAKLLAPFRLRSKVKIRDVSTAYDVYGAWGPHESGLDPERSWKFGSGGAAEVSWTWRNGARPVELGTDEIGCWDLRAGFQGGMGRHVIVPKGKTRMSFRVRETCEAADVKQLR